MYVCVLEREGEREREREREGERERKRGSVVEREGEIECMQVCVICEFELEK